MKKYIYLLIFGFILFESCKTKGPEEPAPVDVPKLTITSFSPDSAEIGATVSIRGENFAPIPSDNIVKFNGLQATVQSVTVSSLLVTIPQGAITGKVTIEANGQIAESPKNFKIARWVKKADFGGEARISALSFVIGTKAYIALGSSSITGYFLKDFWEYDPVANTWTQKADFADERERSVAFAIGNKGYITAGFTGSGLYSQTPLHEYDPVTNTWTRKVDYPDVFKASVTAFTIGTKAYVGTGITARAILKKDLWEYNSETNVWTQKADFGGSARLYSTGFSIDNKGYISCGIDATGYKKDLWEYDPQTDAWTQKADFGGEARAYALSFVIGTKAYVGLGSSSSKTYKDIWQYDPVTNTWIEKEGPPFAMSRATGFAIGDRGYIQHGKSLWQFNPY